MKSHDILSLMPNSSDIPIFAIQNVRFQFAEEDPDSMDLFSGLNLTLQEGESLAVMGPSGVGKTTFLKLMGGLCVPNEGEVKFRGSSVYGISSRHRRILLQRIGMTFQRSGLFDSLTCGDNLRFPLKEVSGLAKDQIEIKVKQALEDVDLQGTENLFVHEMSGGMQKRLGIARAIVLSPEVILYDEPTAGLDPLTARSINQLIKKMREKYKMTLVVVTSDPVQAYALSDRVGFLYQGSFLEVSSTENIRNSENPVVRQFLRGLLRGPLTEEFYRD